MNVTGAAPEYWKKMIQTLSSDYGKEIALEWVLHPASQDVLTSLKNGEIDAACGCVRICSRLFVALGLLLPVLVTQGCSYLTLWFSLLFSRRNWVASGSWNDPATGQDVARALGFSMMQCPIFFSQGFVYTSSDSGIGSFEGVVDAVEGAEDSPYRICVTGTRYSFL